MVVEACAYVMDSRVYVRMSVRDARIYARIYARVCVRVRTHARVSILRELK